MEKASQQHRLISGEQAVDLQACSTVKPGPQPAANRGLAWVIGAFLICPCHLPLTLAVLGALLSGTAAAALLHDHPYLAGAAISLIWLTATGHGIRQIQSAEKMRT